VYTPKRQRRAFAPALWPLLALALILPAAFPAAAEPTLVPCEAAGLAEAVGEANRAPGPETLLLEAGCEYRFIGPHRPGAFTALPLITDPLTIIGNGAVITRAGDTRMRLIEAAAPLALHDLRLVGGHPPAGQLGGAVLAAEDAPLQLTGVSLEMNFAATGGAVASYGALVGKDVRLTGNWAESGYGGAIYAEGELRLSGALFRGNRADASGGAIEYRGLQTALVENSRLSANDAERGFGGAISAAGPLELRRSALAYNRAGGHGGAIYAAAGLLVVESSLDENQALGAGRTAYGGAIYAAATMALERATLRANGAVNGAHAIYLAAAPDTVSRIADSLLYENGPRAPQSGAVLCLFCGGRADGATVELAHTTLANAGRARTGLQASSGTVHLRNSIVSGFAIGVDGGGAARSRRNLYFGNDTDRVNTSSERDISGLDPRFTDPERRDYRLLPGSPALDSAEPLGHALDRRGVHRPQGLAPDLGAYELDLGAIPASHIRPVACDVGALVAAVEAANRRPGADRLALAQGCAYSLNEVYARTIHPFLEVEIALGLPPVTDYLELVGDNSGIQRAASAPDMALLYATGATLRLAGLSLAGARSPGEALLFDSGDTLADDLLLDGVALRDNAALDVSFGGGLLFRGGRLAVERSAFTANRSGGSCGALIAGGNDISVRTSHFADNQAAGRGGAVCLIGGDLLVQDSHFVGNRAEEASGLVVEVSSVPARLINNVWHANQPDVASGVVQIGSDSATADAVLLHNTFLGADPAPGLAAHIQGRGTLTMANTIVAGYSLGVVASGEARLIAGRNLFWRAQTAGDALVADPRFVDPAVGDLRLRPESPAIDAGAPAGVTADIRGLPRPQGGAPDLGAYEHDPAALTPSPTPGPSPTPPVEPRPYRILLPLLRR
jgi:predicted outer membrane repeat protein